MAQFPLRSMFSFGMPCTSIIAPTPRRNSRTPKSMLVFVASDPSRQHAEDLHLFCSMHCMTSPEAKMLK